MDANGRQWTRIKANPWPSAPKRVVHSGVSNPPPTVSGPLPGRRHGQLPTRGASGAGSGDGAIEPLAPRHGVLRERKRRAPSCGLSRIREPFGSAKTLTRRRKRGNIRVDREIGGHPCSRGFFLLLGALPNSSKRLEFWKVGIRVKQVGFPKDQGRPTTWVRGSASLEQRCNEHTRSNG